MLRKPALVVGIFLTLFTFTAKPAHASTSLFSIYRHYFPTLISFIRSKLVTPQVAGASLTPTPTPVITSSPTQTPEPTPTPEKPVLGSTDADVKQFIMDEINTYRRSQGLPEVQTDPFTCDFAEVRVQEIAAEFNHDGFRQRIDKHTLPYPSYSRVTENLAENGNYKNVVSAWIKSPGHAENMRQDTPFVCVEKNGKFYAYEGWKP